jgi:hypothetical protein
MDALRYGTRIRIAAALEWLVAVAFLFATVAVVGMILSELRARPRPRPSVAAAVQPAAIPAAVPAVIPARAVSVPVLPFGDGKELRVGDTLSVVAARLGRAAENGKQVVEPGGLGERLTRFYEYGGWHFIVVFEPFERNGEMRIASIYLP